MTGSFHMIGKKSAFIINLVAIGGNMQKENPFKTLLKTILYRFGYVQREFIKRQLEFVLSDIQKEIDSNSQYPNIGKIGCMKRIQKVIDLL
jgi:hypothetical protein